MSVKTTTVQFELHNDLAAPHWKAHKPMPSTLATPALLTADFATNKIHCLPIPSPGALRDDIPLTPALISNIVDARQQIRNIIHNKDPRKRLLVVVGPCSIHDPAAALEYCNLLHGARQKHQHDLVIVMRCYLEKPRTTTGWKGLLSDPHLDGSHDLATGLRVGRKLLADVAATGMPVAYELLSPIAARFVEDLVSIGCIGARTTESQIHRELASGVDFPVGFKNGTDGSLGAAVNGMRAAEAAHFSLGVDPDGDAAVLRTEGNNDCFIVLRGGSKGPNYDATSTMEAERILCEQGLTPRIMVDCSHGNARGNYEKQVGVVENLAEQIALGRQGVMGVMLESNIHGGKQPLVMGGENTLQYGMSITDGCIGWESTEAVLQTLANAVRLRRARVSSGF